MKKNENKIKYKISKNIEEMITKDYLVPFSVPPVSKGYGRIGK